MYNIKLTKNKHVYFSSLSRARYRFKTLPVVLRPALMVSMCHKHRASFRSPLTLVEKNVLH